MLHPLLQITLIYELKATVEKLWSSFKRKLCICIRSDGNNSSSNL